MFAQSLETEQTGEATRWRSLRSRGFGGASRGEPNGSVCHLQHSTIQTDFDIAFSASGLGFTWVEGRCTPKDNTCDHRWGKIDRFSVRYIYRGTKYIHEIQQHTTHKLNRIPSHNYFHSTNIQTADITNPRRRRIIRRATGMHAQKTSPICKIFVTKRKKRKYHLMMISLK